MIGHLDHKKDVADILRAVDIQMTKSLYAVKELIVFPSFNRFLGTGTLDDVIQSHISADGTMPVNLAKRIFSFLDEQEAVSHAELLLSLNRYASPTRKELDPEEIHGMYIGAILDGDRVISLVTVTEVRASPEESKEVPIR